MGGVGGEVELQLLAPISFPGLLLPLKLRCFESLKDYVLVVMIRSTGTQCR